MVALPELLHGETVAIDMALSLTLASQRELISPQELGRALHLLEVYGLPTYHPRCDEELLMKALADSTSHRDGLQRVPLSRGLGNAVFVNDLTRAEICTAAEYLATRAMHPRQKLDRDRVTYTVRPQPIAVPQHAV
jgi:3-dehydroquinate synthase